MQYYLIQDTIIPCAPEDCSGTDGGMIIAVMNSEEGKSERERLGMRIEFDPTTRDIHSTKVETNFGSLTGTFKILNRDSLLGREHKFAFAMDERRIVFINEHNVVRKMIDVERNKARNARIDTWCIQQTK